MLESNWTICFLPDRKRHGRWLMYRCQSSILTQIEAETTTVGLSILHKKLHFRVTQMRFLWNFGVWKVCTGGAELLLRKHLKVIYMTETKSSNAIWNKCELLYTVCRSVWTLQRYVIVMMVVIATIQILPHFPDISCRMTKLLL